MIMKAKRRVKSPHHLSSLLGISTERKVKTFRDSAKANILVSKSTKITKKRPASKHEEDIRMKLRERIKHELLKKRQDEIDDLLSNIHLII